MAGSTLRHVNFRLACCSAIVAAGVAHALRLYGSALMTFMGARTDFMKECKVFYASTEAVEDIFKCEHGMTLSGLY